MNVKKDFFKYIFIIVFAVLFLCSTAVAVRFGVQNRHLGAVLTEYREQLDTATATNTELGKQLTASRRVIEDCRRQTTELGESARRNIQTARDAIELVREIREKVILLESRFSDSNDDLNDNYSGTPNNEVE